MKTGLTRRQMLRDSAAFTALAMTQFPLDLFGGSEPEGALIPFLDVQPVDPKRPMTKWEDLTSWITPNEKLFSVGHYNTPEVEAATWNLELGGLVNKPLKLSLADIKARRRKTVTATLECSGNGSNPGFMGAIGNIRWTGTPLGPLLRDCAPLKRGIEVVFFGADEKTEKIRDKDYTQNFARSLSLPDAMRDEVILAYEMNGEPLTKSHGAPLRLIVPGWFGIAWIKWLIRIEVQDRRYMSKYMAREYVTIRGEEKDGKTTWRETSVGPMDIKSIVARATRQPSGAVRFTGAAWGDGTPLKSVEVRVDDGPWLPARIDRRNQSKYSWSFWQFDWNKPTPGDHHVVSRAIDTDGRIQPAFEDPAIKLKRTYWEANQQWPRKLRI